MYTRSLSSPDARQLQFNFIRRLIWSISSNFREKSLFKCASQPKSRKIHKKPTVRFQGRSRSSTLVPPESSSAVPVMISNKSVSICNRSHAKQVNSGKMTIS